MIENTREINDIEKYFIIVSHGSPDKTNEEDYSRLFGELEKKMGANMHQIKLIKSYLEFGEPKFEKIIEEIKNKQNQKENVLFLIKPLLFFRAGHMLNDIEAKIGNMKNVQVSGVLAESQKFQNLFSGFVNNFLQGRVNNLSKLKINLENPLFVFVARGTSSKSGASQVYSFSRIIWENLGKKGHMEVCFADVNKPSLKDIVEFVDLKKFTALVIIPMILFRGFVMKKIGKELAHMLKSKGFFLKGSNSSAISYIILPPLGYFSPSEIADALVEFPE